jgi:hypothetical protein
MEENVPIRMLVLLCPLAVMSLLPQPGEGRDPEQLLAQLSRDYGVAIQLATEKVRLQRRGYVVECQPLSTADLERYAPILDREFRRYPKSLFDKISLRRVIVGSGVRVESQIRAAVPDFEGATFWLDATLGGKKPAYGAHVFHHDLYHMIDEVDDVEGRMDSAWRALNDSRVQYGKGGWYMQSGNVGALRTDLPGFLTEYATSAVEEDKAETYAHLITSPAFVRRQAAKDEVLASKVARVKALVKAFEPAMGDAWWPGTNSDRR